MTATTPRAPRKDQLRNRRRLLDAACEAFGQHGPELVSQLLDDLAEGAREVAASAAEIPDDWEAFRAVFTQGCALDVAGLHLFDALCRTSPQAAEHGRRIGAELITPVTERARRGGALRPDVTAEDVAAFMRMADSAPNDDQRRLTHEVMLAGLRHDRAERPARN